MGTSLLTPIAEPVMYKILIVDDFPADRFILRELLAGMPDLNLEITAECEHGLQALDEIEHNRPDIVISDIEMPFCNGFELARNIRQLYPEIKIVFCSLYDEFEYARQALYFGGYGYILKPIDRDELAQCIHKITGKIVDETAEQNRRAESDEIRAVFNLYQPVLLENLLKELLYGIRQADTPGFSDRLAYLGYEITHGRFVVAYIEIDDFETITGRDTFENRQYLSLRISRRIQEHLRDIENTPIIRLDEAHLAVIFNHPDLESAALGKKALDVCTRILIDFQKSDTGVTISLSPACERIDEVAALFQRCLYQMKHKYILGKGKLILPDDVPARSSAPDLDLNAILKEVRFQLNSGTAADIIVLIDNLFTNIPLDAGETYLRNLCFHLVICTQTVLNENNASFKDVFHSDVWVWQTLSDFETVADAIQWIKEVMISSNQFLVGKSLNSNSQIVERIKKYIDVNFSKSFNIEELASEFFYSANYVNRIFKQITGETVFNYASTVRIEKAKEMLLDPRAKLSTVSETLGYSNPAYFSFIFRKATGLTPKEYRDRMNR
jgi:two-component system response regulator YesN